MATISIYADLNVKEIADAEGDGAAVDGRVIVNRPLVRNVRPDRKCHRFGLQF